MSQVEQKKQHASITEAKQSTLEAQLQTEREALERKEKEVSVQSNLCTNLFKWIMFQSHEDPTGNEMFVNKLVVWSQCVGVTATACNV